MTYVKTTKKKQKKKKVSHIVACPIVFILFDDQYWLRGVVRCMKMITLLVFLAGFGLFSQVFGQINDWPILKVIEIKIVLHVIACPIVFILFDGRD